MKEEQELLELVERYSWGGPLLYQNLTEKFIEKYRENIDFYKLQYSSKLSKEFMLKNLTHRNSHSSSYYCFLCDWRLKHISVLKHTVYYCSKCLL